MPEKEEKHIKFRYTKSRDHRVVAANGAHGGMTTRGDFRIDFFIESSGLPDEVHHMVTPDGLGPEIKRLPEVRPIERESQVAIILNMAHAKDIARWLLFGDILLCHGLVAEFLIAERELWEHAAALAVAMRSPGRILEQNAVEETQFVPRTQFLRSLALVHIQGLVEDLDHVLPVIRRACDLVGVDVRAEIRERAATLGQEGGYILQTSHHILWDTPLENLIAYVEEVRGLAGLETPRPAH